MDIIESLFGRFRRREQPTKSISQILEGKFTPRVWTSEHFREYLMGLGRSRNFLLPREQYPDLIELSGSLHDALEDMRKRTTSSGHEH